MKQFVIMLCIVCVMCIGCTSNVPSDVDTPMTSPVSGSGVTGVAPLQSARFDGIPSRIGFEPIALEGGAFPEVTGFVFLPQSHEVLVVNRYGKVGWFRVEEHRAVLLSSFTIPAVFAGGRCGVSSITLDPNFSRNGFFYVGYCLDDKFNVVKRYTMSYADFPHTLYSAENIVAIGDVDGDNGLYPIGALAFAPDGVMWTGVADRHPQEQGQNVKNQFGKILRFIPLKNTSIRGHAPALGNPYGKNELMYAYGFRYPWKGAFDAFGRYWAADNGDGTYHEINIVTKDDRNFGWPIADGVVCTADCSSFTLPIRAWDGTSDHSFIREDIFASADAGKRAAWVGVHYQPDENDRYSGFLTNMMLYGDFYAGFVRGIVMDKNGAVTADRHIGHVELPVAWQQAADGFVYVATLHQSLSGLNSVNDDERQGWLWRAVPLP